MKRILFFGLLLLMGLIPLLFNVIPATAAPLGAGQVSFSEVAPAGALPWVELIVSRPPALTHTTYLPLIRSASGTVTAPAVPSGGMVDLSGWHLTDHDGNRYDFPNGLTVTEGTVILVYFGSGTDDPDSSDGRVTLYANNWGVTPFAPEGDDLTLYRLPDASPEAVADYLAWGQSPGEDANDAVAAEKWMEEAFEFFDEGLGAEGYASPPRPNDALGRWEDFWFPYYASYSTPGEPNDLPRPSEWLTPNGATVEQETFNISWAPIEIEGAQYDFQVATTPDFANPMVNTTFEDSGWRPTDPVAAGLYYWRARLRLPDERVGDWWGPFHVQVMTLDFSAGILRTTMDVEDYQLQRKDTYLLEIGGGPENRKWDEKKGIWVEKGLWREQVVDGIPSFLNVWDAPHTLPNGDPSFKGNGLDNIYCARATASMLNHHYGGNLSQDRIAYYLFEENTNDSYSDRPERDFGFGRGANTEEAIEYALQIDVDVHRFCPNPDGTAHPDDENVRCALSPVPEEPVTLSWTELVTQLNQGEPLAFSSGKHAFIIAGYWEYGGQQWVQRFDPAVKGGGDNCTEDSCGGPDWMLFDDIDHKLIRYYTIPESETPNPRNDEPSIHQDSDNDGMMDFDELYRFGTNRFVADTDEDWLNDKQEVASYTFRADGKYLRPWGPDYDDNGDRMELDWDNDGDRVADGCEDRNGNGYYDYNAGESSNFNDNWHNLCVPRLALLQPSTASPAAAGTFTSPQPMNVVLNVRYPTPMGTPTYNQSAFTVSIGGTPATVLSKGQNGPTVTLNVRPPAQAAPGLYDITVTYASPAGPQSVGATAAVRYDPVPQ